MKIKTSELTGAALDWATAQIELTQELPEDIMVWVTPLPCDEPYDRKYQPSRDWTQGGPIIEREGINVERGNDLIFPKGNEKGEYYEPLWLASYEAGRKFHGQTALIAAMRCYVATQKGDEVEVPDEICS